MKKLLIIPVFLMFILLITSGCIEKKERINLSIVEETNTIQEDNAVKIAIASVISPKESYSYYEEMIQYISKKLGVPVKMVQRRTYKEINELIKNHEVNLAFVCSGAYVDGDAYMKLLVAPVIYGKTTYHSYIIVNRNSSYSNFLELRGKRFAFSDPLSNSGYYYPTYRLALINETPESFFGNEKGKNFFFTYSHDNSIIAVAEGLADGAAVDSLVYEYMKNIRPEIIAKTKIIEVSPAFGIPPVVVPKDINPYLEDRLREIFIDMDKDEEGRAILSRIMIDRFVNIDDSVYDSIREMRKRIS